MKHFLTILVFTSLISTLFTCVDSEAEFKYENIYVTSLERWKSLKKTHGNSYKYQIKFESWAGFGTVTEITVIDNVVKSRKGEAYRLIDDNDNPLVWEDRIISESIFEDENTLDSYDNYAIPVTIDALYATCISEYLMVNPNENTIYFEVFDNGILKNCSYVPNGCIDDCLIGISISHFEWINQ